MGNSLSAPSAILLSQSPNKIHMLTYTVLCLIGLIVGSMNAIAGGGMLIGFPLMIAFGVPPLVANATANMITPGGQIASAYAYRQYLRKVPVFYALLLLPVAIGSAAGALLLRHTSAERFASMVPELILFAIILFALQPLLHFHLNKHLRSRARHWVSFILIAVALLPVSVYGGYFGAGYGFIMLAFIGFTKIHEMHEMNAMKNVANIVVAAISLACLWTAHLVDWRVGVAMGVGTTIGGYIGARLSQRVSSHTLRIAVIVLGLVATIYLGFRHY